jgi:hypothetical protein
MKIRIEREGYTQLPDARYRLRIVAIRRTTWTFGPAYEWEFEVASGRWSGCRLKGMVNKTNGVGPRQKFGRWYHAITGNWLKVGDEVDTGKLLGQLVWAEVHRTISKKGKPSNHLDLVPPDDEHTHNPS